MHKLCAVLLFFLLVAAGAAAEELHWIRLDMPPVNIVRQPLKDKGYADRFLRDFLPAMKGYEHKVFTGSIARTLDLIRETPNVCNMTLLYQKRRDEFVHYSEPIMGLVPNRVLVVAGNEDKVAPYLTAAGIDLTRLLRESRLMVGVINGRAYGDFIDAQLEAGKPFRTVYILPKSVLGARQLFAGRLDVLLAYVHEALYFKRVNNITGDVVSFPVKGEKLVDMYMGCSDSPFGRRAIKDINRLLDEGMRGVFLRHYLEWVDAGSHDAVRAHVAGRSGVSQQ